MTATCPRVDQVEGCVECLAGGGRAWRLRMCQSRGAIGRGESSPHRRASRRARATGHAIARSADPREQRSWCYVDEITFVIEAR